MRFSCRQCNFGCSWWLLPAFIRIYIYILILYYIILYYLILYYIILYCIVLYSIIQYHIISYYIILYYIILYINLNMINSWLAGLVRLLEGMDHWHIRAPCAAEGPCAASCGSCVPVGVAVGLSSGRISHALEVSYRVSRDIPSSLHGLLENPSFQWCINGVPPF